MAARIGIELSPFAWRIVELEAQASVRDGAVVRVRAFASLPAGGALVTDQLALLKDRHAAVVLWGLTTEHCQVIVNDAPYDRMLDEARTGLRNRGLAGPGALADIAPVASGQTPEPDDDRREVMLVSAPSSDVYHALRPLTLAGIKVDRVFTPASALLSLARMRRSLTPPESVEAYVVVEETASCLALIRSGTLVAARELRWGYLDDDDLEMRTIRPRDEIATRLGDALADFLTDCQVPRETFTQVCVCGGVPELRSATLPLMEILDVEVEALDSLFGIDEANLPQPADPFRERVAELRLAWAAAADERPPLDLLRSPRRRVMKVAMSKVAVVAGVVVGLGVGWGVERQLVPAASAARLQARRAAPPRAGSTTAVTFRAAARRVVEPPAPPPVRAVPAAPNAGVREPAPIVVSRPPPSAPLEPLPIPATRSTQLATLAPAQPPAPEVDRLLPPIPTPAPVLTVAAGPGSVPEIQRPSSPVAETVAPPARAALPPRPPAASARTSVQPTRNNPPARRVAAPSPPPLMPFEADLATILYGPNRQVALVDGRVVEAGDVVRGARVVEITRSTVMLRDGSGRLRELTADTGRVGRQ